MNSPTDNKVNGHNRRNPYVKLKRVSQGTDNSENWCPKASRIVLYPVRTHPLVNLGSHLIWEARRGPTMREYRLYWGITHHSLRLLSGNGGHASGNTAGKGRGNR